LSHTGRMFLYIHAMKTALWLQSGLLVCCSLVALVHTGCGSAIVLCSVDSCCAGRHHHSLLLTTPCSAWAAVWRSQIVRLHLVTTARFDSPFGPDSVPRRSSFLWTTSVSPRCIQLIYLPIRLSSSRHILIAFTDEHLQFRALPASESLALAQHLEL
jgi:hypothetical protein